MRIRVVHNDAEIEIDVARQTDGSFRIAIDGETIEAAATASLDGIVRFEHDGRISRMAGVARGEARQLWVDGRVIRYDVRSGARSQSTAHDHGLASPAPGVVAEVHAQVGQVVRKGEKLIVLESMKMFFPVLAPHDGRVARVLCAKGESVDAGVPLLEFADDSDGA
ncbi:MAG: biotin/lipoyl-containing protein [bacterium]